MCAIVFLHSRSYIFYGLQNYFMQKKNDFTMLSEMPHIFIISQLNTGYGIHTQIPHLVPEKKIIIMTNELNRYLYTFFAFH